MKERQRERESIIQGDERGEVTRKEEASTGRKGEKEGGSVVGERKMKERNKGMGSSCQV